MYQRIEDFLQDWNNESQKTLAILSSMTDESLTRRVTPEGRDVAFLSWHVAMSINDFMLRIGIPAPGQPDEEQVPDTAAAICEAYESASALLTGHIKGSWSDATLQEEHDLYGARWKNANTLVILIRHQIHHRAQLTVLLRQAGVRVPGVYGPAREEWAAMGMEAKR